MFAVTYSTQAILPEIGRTFDVSPAEAGLTVSVVVLALTMVRGWVRWALLVPTLWLAALVWETRLVEEGTGPTRFLLLGAILVVLMAARPEGLLGTRRVEIV